MFCFACRARTQPLVTMDRGSSHTEPCARRRGSSGLSERSRGRTRVAPPLSPPLAETAAADRDSKRAATSTDAPVTSPPPHHPINHHAFPLFPSSNSPRRRRLPPPSPPPRPIPSHTAGRVAPPLRLRRRRRLPAAPVSVSQASVPSRVEGRRRSRRPARGIPPARPPGSGRGLPPQGTERVLRRRRRRRHFRWSTSPWPRETVSSLSCLLQLPSSWAASPRGFSGAAMSEGRGGNGARVMVREAACNAIAGGSAGNSALPCVWF